MQLVCRAQAILLQKPLNWKLLAVLMSIRFSRTTRLSHALLDHLCLWMYLWSMSIINAVFFFPKVFHFSCFAYYKYELLLPIISINSSSFINQHFGSKARRFLIFLLFTTLFSLLKWRNDEWYLINICVTAHYELFGLSEDGWCWGEPKHCFNQLTTYCS